MIFRHPLYLCADAAQVRAQLAGRRLTLAEARPLRDDVSTDEISPLPAMVHFDATLALRGEAGVRMAADRA